MEAILFIQRLVSPAADFIIQAITMLGEEEFLIIVVLAIFLCFDKKLGIKLAIIALFSNLVCTGLKEITRVQRPIGSEGVRSIRTETATGYSFPSGHTTSASTLLFTLSQSLKRPYMYVIAAVLSVLVAISRLYLGVHWPSDVIVGLITGLTASFALGYAMDMYLAKPLRISHSLLMLIPLAALLIFYPDVALLKLMGAFAAVIIGAAFEERYVGFDPKRGKWWAKLLRFICAVVVLFGLKEGLKLILPDHFIAHTLRYAVLGFSASYAIPSALKKLDRNKTNEV